MLPFDCFGEPHQQVRGGLVERRPFRVHDALVRLDGMTQDDLGIVDAECTPLNEQKEKLLNEIIGHEPGSLSTSG